MNDLTKTLIVVGTALLVAVIAIVTRPSPAGVEPDAEIGQPLFPDLKDPLAVTDLEIVKFDEGLAELSRFKVAQVDGIWSIVSQDNYPVDAKDQMRDVASSVMDLRILGVETPGDEGDSNQGDLHKDYGVVEPDREKIKWGAKGVGTLVIMKNAEGKDLARLIIGKKVDEDKEDSFSQDKSALHFVRRAGQDRVYTVKMDVSKLSTKFEDWIERDLLKLDPWDIKEVELNDYAIVTVRTGGGLRKTVQERSRMTFAQDNNKWTLKKMQTTEGKETKTVTSLGKDEELNETKLNELKEALDDLKIAGVERRPKSIVSNLLTGKISKMDNEGAESLVRHGFFPGQDQDTVTKKPVPRIYSDSGEIGVGMKSGVEYVIRFGEVSGSGESVKKDDKKKNDKKDDKKDDKKKDSDVGLNRYVLVTARVNEALLTKPTLKPKPKKPTKPAEKKKDDKKKDDKKSETKKNDKKKDDKKSETKKSEGKKGKDKKAEPKKKDAKEQQKEEEKKYQEALKKYEEELKKIKEENQKAQEEYDNKVKEAKKTVRELNTRFSEWYFIISEDVYKKIHLTRSDLITKKETPKEEKKEEKPKEEKKEEKKSGSK